jgi:hypothetical protein
MITFDLDYYMIIIISLLVLSQRVVHKLSKMSIDIKNSSVRLFNNNNDLKKVWTSLTSNLSSTISYPFSQLHMNTGTTSSLHMNPANHMEES